MAALSSAVTDRCHAVLCTHLLVSIDKEVVEIVNANEPQAAVVDFNPVRGKCTKPEQYRTAIEIGRRSTYLLPGRVVAS